MDHYCPWMKANLCIFKSKHTSLCLPIRFNCIGFANYRYFVLFLFYVTVACTYGVVLTLSDFSAIAGPRSPNIIHGIRITNNTRTAVMFTFILALSVGIAVAILFSWHVLMRAASL